MSMSRRDFEGIAQAVKNAALHEGSEGRAMRYEIAQNVAHFLATTNPAFDRARFLSACGVFTSHP